VSSPRGIAAEGLPHGARRTVTSVEGERNDPTNLDARAWTVPVKGVTIKVGSPGRGDALVVSGAALDG
jgi:hypothetical protein